MDECTRTESTHDHAARGHESLGAEAKLPQVLQPLLSDVYP